MKGTRVEEKEEKEGRGGGQKEACCSREIWENAVALFVTLAAF